jgi:hypothetical protein
MGTVPLQESVSNSFLKNAASRTFKMALLVCLRSLDDARARAARARRAGKN